MIFRKKGDGWGDPKPRDILVCDTPFQLDFLVIFQDCVVSVGLQFIDEIVEVEMM